MAVSTFEYRVEQGHRRQFSGYEVNFGSAMSGDLYRCAASGCVPGCADAWIEGLRYRIINREIQ